MKFKEAYEEKIKINIPKEISLPKEDIDRIIEKAYDTIIRNADSEHMVMFSYLIKRHLFNDIIIELFVPLIMLANANRIKLIQEEFFNDIVIVVI